MHIIYIKSFQPSRGSTSRVSNYGYKVTTPFITLSSGGYLGTDKGEPTDLSRNRANNFATISPINAPGKPRRCGFDLPTLAAGAGSFFKPREFLSRRDASGRTPYFPDHPIDSKPARRNIVVKKEAK